MKIKNALGAALLLCPALSMAQAQSQTAEPESRLRLSGYLSIIAGTVVGGTMEGNHGPSQILGRDCPCFPADYATAASYGSTPLTLGQETRAGIQAQYTLNDSLSLVGALAAHASDSAIDLASAYVKYSPDDSIDLRFGRQRIPIYYYSNLQSIGFVYPFISPPPELYGWDATYYNGTSLRLAKNFGSLNLAASVFGGSEHVPDSSFYKFARDGRTTVDWTALVGGEIEATRRGWSTRAFALRAKVNQNNAEAGIFDSPSSFTSTGLGFGYESSTWIGNAEATRTSRFYPGDAPIEVPSIGYTIGVGRHFGKWTPYASHSSYAEKSSDVSQYEPVGNSRTSFTLRYDLDSNTSIKTQFDRNRDDMNNYGGHANIFRISYDKMFF